MTYSPKLVYILRPATPLMYIAWIIMILGFINTKISNNYKLLSFNNLHSSTILPTSPFIGEKCTLSHFLGNIQNSNLHSLCEVGEFQMRLIKTDV